MRRIDSPRPAVPDTALPGNPWREVTAAASFGLGCLGAVAVVGTEGTEGIVGAFLALALGWLLSQLAVRPRPPRGSTGRGAW